MASSAVSTSWVSDSASSCGTRKPSARRSSTAPSSTRIPARRPGHNERLEFLGDAVIGHDRQPAPVRPLPRRGRGLPDRPPRRARQPRLPRRDRASSSASTATSCSAGARPRRAAPPAHRSWPATFEALAGAICVSARASAAPSAGCAASSTRRLRRAPRRAAEVGQEPPAGVDAAAPSAASRTTSWSSRPARRTARPSP